MTTNDIGAIRDQAQQYSGATGANQSYRAHVLAHRVPALCNEVEQLRAEREHMELNPTGTAEWLKNRVNELTAELDRVRAAEMAKLRAQVAVLAELKDRTAEARGARSDYEELKGVNADTARERDEARAELDTNERSEDARLAIAEDELGKARLDRLRAERARTQETQP